MDSPARYIGSFGQHALVVVASLAQHIGNALWPFQNIAPGRQLPLPIDAMEVLPTAAASAAVIVVALLAAWKGGAGRVPALLFLAFVAALIPVANIVPIPAVTDPREIGVASRYLTFPLVFACLAVPFLVRSADTALAKRVRYGRAFLGLILAVWLLGSAANVRVIIPLWKNDAVMNTWAIRQDGPSSWRYANLGAYYVRQWELAEARNAYLRAIELHPDYHFAWYALGAIETSLGNYESAIRAHRRALETNPDDYMNRIRLAVLERSRNRSQTAVELLEEALRRPRDPHFDPRAVSGFILAWRTWIADAARRPKRNFPLRTRWFVIPATGPRWSRHCKTSVRGTRNSRFRPRRSSLPRRPGRRRSSSAASAHRRASPSPRST